MNYSFWRRFRFFLCPLNEVFVEFYYQNVNIEIVTSYQAPISVKDFKRKEKRI